MRAQKNHRKKTIRYCKSTYIQTAKNRNAREWEREKGLCADNNNQWQWDNAQRYSFTLQIISHMYRSTLIFVSSFLSVVQTLSHFNSSLVFYFILSLMLLLLFFFFVILFNPSIYAVFAFGFNCAMLWIRPVCESNSNVWPCVFQCFVQSSHKSCISCYERISRLLESPW